MPFLLSFWKLRGEPPAADGSGQPFCISLKNFGVFCVQSQKPGSRSAPAAASPGFEKLAATSHPTASALLSTLAETEQQCIFMEAVISDRQTDRHHGLFPLETRLKITQWWMELNWEGGNWWGEEQMWPSHCYFTCLDISSSLSEYF